MGGVWLFALTITIIPPKLVYVATQHKIQPNLYVFKSFLLSITAPALEERVLHI